jgi:hypothetical protein
MFSKQKALWRAEGYFVNYGAIPKDGTGWRCGGTNTGILQAHSVVEAHNEIVEALFKEHEDLKEELRRVVLHQELKPAEKLAAVAHLLNGKG